MTAVAQLTAEVRALVARVEALERQVKTLNPPKNGRQEAIFRMVAPRFGLEPDDFGREFAFRSNTYRIDGLNPAAPRYPVHASRQPDGKGFRFPVDIVQRALGRTPSPATTRVVEEQL